MDVPVSATQINPDTGKPEKIEADAWTLIEYQDLGQEPGVCVFLPEEESGAHVEIVLKASDLRRALAYLETDTAPGPGPGEVCDDADCPLCQKRELETVTTTEAFEAALSCVDGCDVCGALDDKEIVSAAPPRIVIKVY